MKSLIKDKKGVFGLTSIQAFFAIILGVALLAYVIIVVMGTLQSSTILHADTVSGVAYNETVAKITLEVASSLTAAGYDGHAACTAIGLTNKTAKGQYNIGNVTVDSTACTVVLAADSDASLNGTAMNLTYSYTRNSPSQSSGKSILQNTSTGITGFFSGMSPVYSILAILVIILVLVVLVRVVTGGAGPGISGTSSSPI